MVNKLADFVTANQIGVWLLIAFLVCYFVYKEWPGFKQRVRDIDSPEEKVDQLEACVEEMRKEFRDYRTLSDQKFQRDFDQIHMLTNEVKRHKEQQFGMRNELRLLVDTQLSVLQALQQLGANGPTKEAEKKIQNYINEQAHANNEDDDYGTS
jgi:hypothetical protein